MINNPYAFFLKKIMADKMDNSQQFHPAPPPQNEPFVIKYLKGAQFLSPAVQTAAITSLADRMTTHFAGEGWDPNDKPTCVTCFDMSGTGKTTTIMELSDCQRVFMLPSA